MARDRRRQGTTKPYYDYEADLQADAAEPARQRRSLFGKKAGKKGERSRKPLVRPNAEHGSFNYETKEKTASKGHSADNVFFDQRAEGLSVSKGRRPASQSKTFFLDIRQLSDLPSGDGGGFSSFSEPDRLGSLAILEREDEPNGYDFAEQDSEEKPELSGRVRGGRRQRQKKKFSWGRLAAAAAALAVVFFFLFQIPSMRPANIALAIGDFFAGFGKGDGYPVDLRDLSIAGAVSNGQDIVVVTDISTRSFSNTAKEQYNRQHGFAAPAIKMSGRRALVFDQGGQGYQIEARSKHLYSGKVQGELIAGDIAETGNYILAAENDAYKSVVTVFNLSHQEIFSWSSGERRVVAVAISPNGRTVAVAALSVENGQLISTVFVFRTNQKDPIRTEQYYSTMLLSADFKDNKHLAVIGDNMAAVLPTDKKKPVKLYEFGGYQLVTCDNTGDSLFFSISQYGEYSNGRLVALSETGKLVFEVPYHQRVVSMAGIDNFFYVLTDDRLVHVGTRGEMKETEELSATAFKVLIQKGEPILVGNAKLIKY